MVIPFLLADQDQLPIGTPSPTGFIRWGSGSLHTFIPIPTRGTISALEQVLMEEIGRCKGQKLRGP